MLPELDPIVDELNRNRHKLAEQLDALTDEELSREPGGDRYSGRQVLAHLAGAESGMTRLMKAMAAGQEPRLKPDYNNDYYNARQQEKRANMSIADLKAELEWTRAALFELMEQLKEEDLSKRGQHPVYGDSTVLEVLKILRSHEAEHISEFTSHAQELTAARS